MFETIGKPSDVIKFKMAAPGKFKSKSWRYSCPFFRTIKPPFFPLVKNKNWNLDLISNNLRSIWCNSGGKETTLNTRDREPNARGDVEVTGTSGIFSGGGGDKLDKLLFLRDKHRGRSLNLITQT